MLGDQVNVRKARSPGREIGDTVGDVPQLQPGGTRIFDGYPQEASGPAVFDEKIPACLSFLLPQMEREQERRGRFVRTGFVHAEKIGKQHPSPALGLKGPEYRLHAISEVAVVKGQALRGVEPCVDHDPIQTRGGQLRRQVRIDLPADHDVGGPEAALFDHFIDEELGKGVQIPEHTDMGQVDAEVSAPTAFQGNAQGRHLTRRSLFKSNPTPGFPHFLFPDQGLHEASYVTSHHLSPLFELAALACC